MRTVLFGFFAAVHDFIHRPWVVLWTCLALAFVNVVMDGTLLRIWSLNRDVQQLSSSSNDLKKEITDLNHRIKQATDPSYVEREARDRFDLVSEGDLVFVFTDEE
ncbi:MAG: septum formation initiator family protein [Bdellovibrionales bacterium]